MAEMLAGANAEAGEHRQDGAGARIDGDAVRNAAQASHLDLEVAHLGAERRIVLISVARQAVAAQDVQNLVDLLLPDKFEAWPSHCGPLSSPSPHLGAGGPM